jgi:hypothetical protein
VELDHEGADHRPSMPETPPTGRAPGPARNDSVPAGR